MTSDRSADFREAAAVPGGQAGQLPAGQGPGPAGQGPGPAEDGQGRLRLPLALELILVTTEPFSGTVAVADSDRRLEFHGWIDLMSAISVLCAAEGPAVLPAGEPYADLLPRRQEPGPALPA